MRTHRWPYGPCFICVLAPFGRVSVSPSSFGENRRFFIKEVEKPSLSCHQTIIKLRTRMPRFPHRANCISTRGKVCLLVRPSVAYAFFPFSMFDNTSHASLAYLLLQIMKHQLQSIIGKLHWITTMFSIHFMYMYVQNCTCVKWKWRRWGRWQ